MSWRPILFAFAVVALTIFLVGSAPDRAFAQDGGSDEEQAEDDAQDEEQAPDDEVVKDSIVVTGSRIATSPLTRRAPVVEVEALELESSGLTNLGVTLQQLPSMGTAISQRFNVPGNSGFPQDGSGIGAGAVQLSLRNLGAKRTLILVDGKRWIAGASASGVPNAVDLNTLPANMIKRVEVLQDGASAVYGSDAIGGVVNIITESDFEGMSFEVQHGEFLSEGDGEGTATTFLWGGGDDRTHLVVSAAYYEEGAVTTTDRAQSAFPNPFATSCDVPGTFCSSFTPQGRFVLGPNFDFASITLNDGVLNDGGANIPLFNPANPASGDFHAFTNADRFNYNGNGFNFLATPNERFNLYTTITRDLTDNTRLVAVGSYTNRTSMTQAAPEPLCIGAGCGNRIAEETVIHRDQIYNPFGVDLSVANGNLEFFARRPLESGPRIFNQDINTYLVTLGLEGTVDADRLLAWDVSATYADNRGFQEKQGAHNQARLAIALGDPAVCAATPNCVPFNFFGGQGPDGLGSITQEMLDFVGFVQRDFSEQTLLDIVGNFTGDLATLPNGATVGFAVGAEYREHEGSFRPDPVAASGETAGIPSGPTAGGFDVSEFYAEVNVPLVLDKPGAEYLEVNLAGRYSDYSTFGGEDAYKAGVLYKPTPNWSLRGSFSTGLRAPSIGELFGGAAREDFTFLDPCVDVLGTIGSGAGGRDTPQPQNIIDNCAALGVPVNFTQRNPQLSAVSAGNRNLIPETSDNTSFGIVYSPSGRSWSVTADIYDVKIDDAIQGRDPGDVLTACVDTLDPFFCDAVERADSGQVNLIDNQLQNIGSVEASGADLGFRWSSAPTGAGQFNVRFDATYLDEYVERTRNPDGSLTSTDRTGTVTDETFMRGFPELRALAALDWSRNRWGAGGRLRYVDGVTEAGGSDLSSVFYLDTTVSYDFPFSADDSATLTFGINNLLDEDPPACPNCGVVGMAWVIHEIPGTVGYVRLGIDIK